MPKCGNGRCKTQVPGPKRLCEVCQVKMRVHNRKRLNGKVKHNPWLWERNQSDIGFLSAHYATTAPAS